MAKIHVFADESGNFDFSRTPGASRYFIIRDKLATEFQPFKVGTKTYY